MKNLFIICFLITGLFLLGCKQEPSTISQELEVDAVVEQQAAFGWQVNQIVQTGDEILEVTRNSDFLEGDEIDTTYGVKALKKKSMGLLRQMQQELDNFKGLYKPLDDSLVLKLHFPFQGVRLALYYDSQTGKG